MKTTLTGLAFLVIAALGAREAAAHCQVPCGIYDDAARIQQLQEDASTITKAIANIQQLSGKHDSQAFNQATRWVTTKDAHASNIITIVAEYFLTQKVKPVGSGGEGYDTYLASLADHHAVMRAAMKTKQQANPAAAKELDEAVAQLATRY